MTVRPPMISRRHGFSSVGIYEGLKRAPFWRGGGDIIRSAFGRMEGVRGYNSKRFWPLCTVPGSEYSVNSFWVTKPRTKKTGLIVWHGILRRPYVFKKIQMVENYALSSAKLCKQYVGGYKR